MPLLNSMWRQNIFTPNSCFQASEFVVVGKWEDKTGWVCQWLLFYALFEAFYDDDGDDDVDGDEDDNKVINSYAPM